MSDTRNLLNKTANAGTMNSFGDRFDVGNHVAALDHIQIKKVWNEKLQDKIVAVCADFIVMSSDKMKAGTKVSEKYDIGMPGNSGGNAAKRLNGLARAITESLGTKQKEDDVGGAAFNKVVEDNLYKLLEIDEATGLSRESGRRFIGRGVSLKVYSKTNIGSAKGAHAGKVFVNNDFSSLEQTKEQIKAKRSLIEAPPAPTASAQASDALKASAGQTPTATVEAPDMLSELLQ